jgi:hypothetical protein
MKIAAASGSELRGGAAVSNRSFDNDSPEVAEHDDFAPTGNPPMTTTKDAAINRILTLMELSAQLQTESLAKSEASLHAAEQAGQVADAVGINWEADVEPLLGERHTARVLTNGLTTEPTNRNLDTRAKTKCFGHH